ncbi:hypothetical protein KY330_03980 [Candidatus Woesearchaeota archaeon]|nr:hypothetical protein [Candidatus Woesearchaeota archaeon]
MAKNNKLNISEWIIPEIAFYGFLYYALYVLNVQGNPWVHALILWLLINISIIWCPVVKKCCK